jgi:uncharacterized protein (UPF0548 family)
MATKGERDRRRLQALEDLGINYAVADRSEVTEANGWRIDSYRTDLPPEPPGAPVAGGSFALARSVVERYGFVDPGLIRGYYDPEAPLLGRVMLLKVKVFGLFRFEFGVRINRVIDEERADEYVWGYAYQTLEGHFEMGEITFEVAKQKESGRVIFRIDAYSKLGTIRNLVYRVGARLFARRLQLRYAEYALKRLPELVAEGMRES